MLATGRPTELAKILEPLAMPPEETISSSADANGEVANSTAVQHRHHVAEQRGATVDKPPDKTLIVASASFVTEATKLKLTSQNSSHPRVSYPAYRV